MTAFQTFNSWEDSREDRKWEQEKIDLVRRHRGARFEFLKNPSNIFEKNIYVKQRALQICKFLKKNTLYFGHSKKDKYGYF
jgi:hypothetical protein